MYLKKIMAAIKTQGDLGGALKRLIFLLKLNEFTDYFGKPVW